MSIGILGKMKSGGGTLPPTEKVPSSCLGHLLFEAISLAKPFGVDVHPT